MSEAAIKIKDHQEFRITLKQSTTTKLAEVRQLFHNEDSAFDVKSQNDFDYLAELLGKMKAMLKEIEDDRSALTSPLESAKKSIIAEFKPVQEECASIEAKCKRAMNTFLDDQERIRRKAQAEAEERARKERDRLAKRAEQAEARGKTEKAEELQMQSMATQAAEIEAPKTKGVTGRTIWTAEVTDKKAFLEAALSNPMLLALITIDQKKLNQMATALNEEFDVPGVKAKSNRSLAISRQ